MARISVLIPVRDAGPFLGPALASVRNQTLRDFEALLLDDGSTDGSSEELACWEARDARFRVIRPGRVGLVAALNRLGKDSESPLLARFDADDAMHPRRLELQAARLAAEPAVDIVSCLVRHFPRNRVRGGNLAYEEWLNALVDHEAIRRDMLVESPLAHPSVTMRREVFEKLGGYRDLEMPEDYDFWLRALDAGFRFAKVERVLHFWREHPGRLTYRSPRCSVEAFLRAKVAALLRGPLRFPRPFVVWGAGMLGRRLTRRLVRAGRTPLALLDIDPRKVGRTRQGRPVLPPEAWRAGSTLLLAAVGARGAREKIRARLAGFGLVETRDFWMVA